MSSTILISVLLSFGITVVLAPLVIPFLRRLHVGQTVRTEGPQEHLKKNGTPTMGGILILFAVFVTSLVFVMKYPNTEPVLAMTVAFGLIGFLDDYIKVVLKRSMGLRAWQKFLLQFIVTGVFALYLWHNPDISLAMRIPFTAGRYLDLGWGNVVILFIAVLGTVNGVNFTDGLDGLASSVTVPVAIFLTAASLALGAGIEPITCAVCGALLGFLLFNVNPAKVFMGDTGSLALGGFVAAAAYVMQLPIFILLIGLIYLIEVVSVILQVGYFKLTGGKRIFKMAPIHHHFELSGWSETRVGAVFSIVTALLCLLAYYGLRL